MAGEAGVAGQVRLEVGMSATLARWVAMDRALQTGAFRLLSHMS